MWSCITFEKVVMRCDLHVEDCQNVSLACRHLRSADTLCHSGDYGSTPIFLCG